MLLSKVQALDLNKKTYMEISLNCPKVWWISAFLLVFHLKIIVSPIRSIVEWFVYVICLWYLFLFILHMAFKIER